MWGRSLDYLRQHGSINYAAIIRHGLAKEGLKAFFTIPKWFSRVLMNAPAQGTLPWFYNEVLPLGESSVLYAVQATLVRLDERCVVTKHRSRTVSTPKVERTLHSSHSSTLGATSPR